MKNWKAHKITMVDLVRINPYSGNPRIHPDSQIEKLVISIQQFGFVQPLLIDGEFNLIAGHGRLIAAKKIGMAQVPSIVIDHLSEREKKALVITDNKLSELSKWDFEKLADEVSELVGLDFDVDNLGFDEQEIESLLQDEPDLLPASAPKTIHVESYDRVESGEKSDQPEKLFQLIVACDDMADQNKLARKLKKEGRTVKKMTSG
jgi:ParB-like chromosome segregation protein Spo0J